MTARIRQAADRMLNRLLVPAAGTPSGVWAVATVASVVPGAAADGNSLVTVTWRGADYTAAYLSHYTPAVGHVVLCAYNGAHLTILGRPIGRPA